MSHPSFQGSDAIYVTKPYHVVKQEGNPDEFFNEDHVQDEVAMDNDGNFILEIDPQVFLSSNWAEDIALVCNQGYNVDDDNEPAPENIPDNDAPLPVENKGLFEGQCWGVEHHVDQMELHGSKNTPSFHEFDPCRSTA